MKRKVGMARSAWRAGWAWDFNNVQRVDCALRWTWESYWLERWAERWLRRLGQ